MTIRVMRPEQNSGDDRSGRGRVVVDDDGIFVDEVLITDPTACMLIATAPEAERPDLLRRLVAVGAHGVASMGLGIDVAALDDRVAATVDGAASAAEQTIRTLLDDSRRSLAAQFDPHQRSSLLAQAMHDFTEWRTTLLDRLDPTVEGSTTTEFINRLHGLVGPDGALEQTLLTAFDLDGSESALSRLRAEIAAGFDEVRREIATERAGRQARIEEAERGTAHGLDFEDTVEAHLRTWAVHRPGTIVERTGATIGALSAAAKVGDFVVTLDDSRRIVVEAKRHGSIGLTGSGGILTELDQALANRSADVAICVAGRDAFPAEVGRFNTYGTRILVVDEGDGVMLDIALRWAAALSRPGAADRVDPTAVADRIDRIRHAAEQLSGARRSVTTMKTTLDKLHEQLGTVRADVLDQLGDLDRIVSEHPAE